MQKFDDDDFDSASTGASAVAVAVAEPEDTVAAQQEDDVTAALAHRLRADVEYAEHYLDDGLEQKGSFADMPLVQVVTALVGAKRVQKVAKKVEDALKEVVLTAGQPRTDAGTPKNAKAFLDGEGGARIELRPSRKVELNIERASAALRGKKLFEEALVTTTTITQPEALYAKLKEAQAALVAAGNTDLAVDIGVVLKTAITTAVTLSEDRLEALVEEGKLTLNEVTTFYDETVSHSVYDVTK